MNTSPLRRITSRTGLALLCASLALAMGAPAALAVETLRIEDPLTDNYKASFNTDPNAPENRSWLSIRKINAASTSWAPIVPSDFAFTTERIDVVAADGRMGVLHARTTAGPLATPLWRNDPLTASSKGRWGILATVTDRAALKTSSGQISLSLKVDGVELATGVVEYRYDAAFATAPAGNLEYNGPGGRWFIGGISTRTGEELAPAVPPTLTASTPAVALPRPRVVALILPTRTAKRVITMRVRGRAADSSTKITHIRTRVGAQRWSAWITVRASYRVKLPAGDALRVVQVQLKDAAGRASPIVARRVRCTCG